MMNFEMRVSVKITRRIVFCFVSVLVIKRVVTYLYS